MQGIYKGYPVMLHDKAWTVILTLSEDSIIIENEENEPNKVKSNDKSKQIQASYA